jgi:hypothetical protein
MKLKNLFAAVGVSVGLLTTSAFAIPITQTFTVYGDLPVVNAGVPGSATAATFNQTAVDAGIVCASGYTCSGATLIDITAFASTTLAGVSTFTNDGSTGLVQYARSLSGASNKGTFNLNGQDGVNTTGTVGNLSASLLISDGITTLVDVNANIATASEIQRGGNGTCSTSNPTNFLYSTCLAVTPGTSKNFSASQLGAGGASYSSPFSPAVLNLYRTFGAGVVTFALNTNGALSTNLPSSAGMFATSTVSSAAATNGLQIDYTYTYEATLIDTSATPEPATFALIGSGLVLLGLARKRRSN